MAKARKRNSPGPNTRCFIAKGKKVCITTKKKIKKRKGPPPKRGECKTVKNKKTGCSIQLCFTGRGVTGWTFKKGTSVCKPKSRR